MNENTAPLGRGIYCNRTLNVGSIKAIGYDMDYTIVQYHVDAWEQRAFEHLKARFLERGWPVEHLKFEPSTVIRGLVIDTQEGNVLKANRFGYVKRAYHGTKPLEFKAQRRLYSRTIADLSAERFPFMNTLFSLSETCMYLQMVELVDEGKLPPGLGYEELYRTVRCDIDAAHLEGELKAEITSDPDRFVVRDGDLARTLLDQKDVGKKLLLITNSDWGYTKSMMSYSLDSFLPEGMSWRDLFELVIVSARKPDFFNSRAPIFEIVNDDGLLRPCVFGIQKPGIYLGGNASLVEEYLGLTGNDLLFVGDHIYADIHVSKNVLRWRTALVLSELEREVTIQDGFRSSQAELSKLMSEKEALETDLNHVRLSLMRLDRGHDGGTSRDELSARSDDILRKITELDSRIAPLAQESAVLSNPHWGLLMRTGNDKSLFARQVEAYADIYTSRVSNFLFATPYAFFRSVRGNLSHDAC
jgi:5'-nucleotidase